MITIIYQVDTILETLTQILYTYSLTDSQKPSHLPQSRNYWGRDRIWPLKVCLQDMCILPVNEVTSFDLKFSDYHFSQLIAYPACSLHVCHLATFSSFFLILSHSVSRRMDSLVIQCNCVLAITQKFLPQTSYPYLLPKSRQLVNHFISSPS